MVMLDDFIVSGTPKLTIIMYCPDPFQSGTYSTLYMLRLNFCPAETVTDDSSTVVPMGRSS